CIRESERGAGSGAGKVSGDQVQGPARYQGHRTATRLRSLGQGDRRETAGGTAGEADRRPAVGRRQAGRSLLPAHSERGHGHPQHAACRHGGTGPSAGRQTPDPARRRQEVIAGFGPGKHAQHRPGQCLEAVELSRHGATLRFLLGTQYDDGSWHVVSRAYPFQPTMDSGFPHGRDSWISAAGTSWAVLAMTEALPAGTATEKPPVVAKEPKDAPPGAAGKGE